MKSVTDACFIFNELLAANTSHPPDSFKTRATELRTFELDGFSQNDEQDKVTKVDGANNSFHHQESEFKAAIIPHCYLQSGGCLKEVKIFAVPEYSSRISYLSSCGLTRYWRLDNEDGATCGKLLSTALPGATSKKVSPLSGFERETWKLMDLKMVSLPKTLFKSGMDSWRLELLSDISSEFLGRILAVSRGEEMDWLCLLSEQAGKRRYLRFAQSSASRQFSPGAVDSLTDAIFNKLHKSSLTRIIDLPLEIRE
ncbi:hypothetical protein CCUS01_15299 [Colletotrichum cuscutae]|uniref:Uncharacterized protein n=1 Tax=Colletotrichum cuscutae TaxID=1209917 RepID=A0AAI9VGG3_9PEZI|nr:hypothetical protein CCUS01_15299 [Colletotrichum cuscutae]